MVFTLKSLIESQLDVNSGMRDTRWRNDVSTTNPGDIMNLLIPYYLLVIIKDKKGIYYSVK